MEDVHKLKPLGRSGLPLPNGRGSDNEAPMGRLTET